METETWKDIPGYEGLYQVSNFGNVRRSAPGYGTYIGRVLHPGITCWGYRQVHLSLNRRVTAHSVHSLVMTTFVGPRPEGMDINHINGNKEDNRCANLCYVTKSENRQHAYDTGLQTAKGVKNSQSKLTVAQVLQIRDLWATGKYLHRDLAVIFGVCREMIGNIVRRDNWKHI